MEPKRMHAGRESVRVADDRKRGPAALLGHLTVIAVLSLGMTAVAAARDPGLPNPHLTPGATNPAVTPRTLRQTVCVRGYSHRIRPPEAYTEKLKREQIRQYGYRDRRLRDYEEDHLIPLSIGGSPTSPRNLWPEPRRTAWNATKKDRLEYAMWRAVCHGEVGLRAAQRAFAGDWITAYRHYMPRIAHHHYTHHHR